MRVENIEIERKSDAGTLGNFDHPVSVQRQLFAEKRCKPRHVFDNVAAIRHQMQAVFGEKMRRKPQICRLDVFD